MIKQKNQPLALLVLFALAVSPLTFLACNMNAYPVVPFGGGGGNAFVLTAAVRYVPSCGPVCGGIIGWAVGAAIDYMINHWNDPAPGMTVGGSASQNQGNPVGGGGGDGF